MSTVAGSPPFRRARIYTSWVDVAQLEERTAQALRRIPQQRLQLLSAPCVVTAGDALQYAVVSGTGVVTVSAERPGQSCAVKSAGGALTVRDSDGALIDGAASIALAAYDSRTLLWTGAAWSIV